MDFGQAGTASLWKSYPLFSTGTKEAELMLEELRLNPRGPGARSGGRSLGRVRPPEATAVDPNLSTTYSEWLRLRSTGGESRIHKFRGARFGGAKELAR